MSSSSRPLLSPRPSGNLIMSHRPFSPTPNKRCACQNCTCKSSGTNGKASAAGGSSNSTSNSSSAISQAPVIAGEPEDAVASTELTPLLLWSTDGGDTQQQVTWDQKLRYYVPCASWLPSYTFQSCLHDFISGLSLASFQIPLAMSYAKTIAHVPPIAGLCAVAVPPMVYTVFGSVPQMIVGPEPSISIVVGGAVEPLLHHDKSIENVLDLVVVISVLSGCSLLGAGLARFGFLDNLLSTALLRGFIGAVGIVMIVNSSVGELGLTVSEESHSPYSKLTYVIQHASEFHPATAKASVCILFSLVVLKLFKLKMVSKNYKKVIFLPEILIIVVFSTILSYYYDWESLGISVTGKIAGDDSFYWKFPLDKSLVRFYRPLISSGITCAILGFFESTTASKAVVNDVPISSNRELVALGFINMVGGTFGALPAFGGYGRSKINAMSGGVTCASGAFMSLVTIAVIRFLLDFLYYLPNCCLSCITTMVGITIIEEVPGDLVFFFRTRGYEELITFVVTFTSAFFISMDIGIIVGTAYSLIRVLKNSSRSRIQILKRSPTSLVDTQQDYTLLEDVENYLVVKIPEPLMFTNTNDLKLKLRRLEMYRSTNHHPATPRFKPHINSIVFDINEMKEMDSSAAQILLELIQRYHQRKIKVMLVSSNMFPEIDRIILRSGIADLVNSRPDGSIYYNSIEEALKLLDQQQDYSDVISYKSSMPSFI